MEKVKISRKKEMAFDAEIEDIPFTIPLDAPMSHGGLGNGLRPKSLMLIALGGCTAMDVAALIRKMRVNIEDFNVEVAASLDQGKPQVFNNFCVHYNFFTDNIPEIETKHKLLKIVEMSQERFCGVSKMYRNIAPVQYCIKLNGQDLESCPCSL